MTQSAPQSQGGGEQPVYRMLLFVAGSEPNSVLARKNLRHICEAHLDGRCDVQTVDVLTDYQSALEHRVLVTPCLVTLEPLPKVLIAGTLRDVEKVLAALRLTE